MAQQFLPLTAKRHADVPLQTTKEARHWARYYNFESIVCPGAVTHVSFSPTSPYDLAISASVRVTILDGQTAKIARVLGGFKDIAYSGSFKRDGRLLVAGGENAVVQIFDVQRRTTLRSFRGHKAAVRTTMFSTDGRRVLSGSDDHTVKLWDLATSKQIASLDEHRDLVRAQAASSVSPHLWATGCYDHKFRMYDLRQPSCIFSLDHTHPIEAVLILRAGGIAVTAGGPEVRVFELFSGGKLLRKLSNHAKAVSSLCLDSAGSKLLSGGLDGMVKVHETNTFDAVASMPFEDQVLSLGLAPDDSKLAAGLASGICSVKAFGWSKKRIKARAAAEVEMGENGENREEDAGFHRALSLGERRRKEDMEFFSKMSRGGLDGNDRNTGEPRPGTQRYFNRGKRKGPTEGDKVVAGREHTVRMRDYDVLLRKFMYGAALDKAILNGDIAVTTAVLEDLIHRDGLRIALKNRQTEEQLLPVLRLVARNVEDPRYMELMLIVANLSLDMYSKFLGRSEEVDKAMTKIYQAVKREMGLENELMKLMGLMGLTMGGTDGRQDGEGDAVD